MGARSGSADSAFGGAGLTIKDAAALLGISTATAVRYWDYARAWLHQEVIKGDR